MWALGQQGMGEEEGHSSALGEEAGSRAVVVEEVRVWM